MIRQKFRNIVSFSADFLAAALVISVIAAFVNLAITGFGGGMV